MRLIAPVVFAGLTAITAPAFAGDTALVERSEPTVDRWFYPFNGTPGSRIEAPIFGATGTPDFDDRDGQIFLRWDVSADVPPGLGADAYELVSLRIVIQNGSLDFVPYDDTVDPFTAYLPDGDPKQTEDDPGEPLELFGVAGRNGWSPIDFPEAGPFSAGELIGTELRNLFPIDYGGDGGGVRDVSNGVRDRFSPTPWAIGTIDGLSNGDPIPTDAIITFDVDLTVPGVAEHFAAELDAGVISVLVTSYRRVEVQAGQYVRVYTKESPFVVAGLVDAARLELEWRPADPAPACPGDFDDTGDVGFSDLLSVLGSWGPCPGCPQDLDLDGAVDFDDLLVILGAFGPCP